jgi:allophanate hydrolase
VSLTSQSLDISSLEAAYRSGEQTPALVAREVLRRIEGRPDDPTWIHLLPKSEVLDAAEKSAPGPLFGIPFAIKDNIDLAGAPTTAACPEYRRPAAVSAPVVQRLIDAGAIPIGKTNLDQFATGLVGVRSPYGIPQNPHNPDYIPGGSSSGSAVAVAAGLSSFALGTDTAGSGRIPAAFNGLVGLKPTRGLLSTRGVVPACRSLDCVSIFAETCVDAARVLSVAAGFDPEDPFSRPAQPPAVLPTWPPRVGIPRPEHLEFFGDKESAALFEKAVSHWESLGAKIHRIDFAPFRDAARLLYEGAWVAERYAAIKPFLETHADALHPVTRKIIEGARGLTAVDAFQSSYKLAELRRRAEQTWQQVDLLVTPTAGTVYKVSEVEADPIRLNSNLGYYTNYMNLFDLCGLAIPAGTLSCEVPFGITLVAPAFHDDVLLAMGARFLGEPAPKLALRSGEPSVKVAVCGAHLSGLPLNGQLLQRAARLVIKTTTSARYRLFEIPGVTPRKPGLIRVERDGASIELEVWEMPVRSFGSFVSGIPSPLGIGQIELADGTFVQGFLCEASVLQGAKDITRFGGWRQYLGSSS